MLFSNEEPDGDLVDAGEDHMADWVFVKARTATEGAVWRSEDGQYCRRSGNVLDEARFQAELFKLGYPVAQVVESGSDGDEEFFIEHSLGAQSLHEQCLTDAERLGAVSSATLADIVDVSRRLLAAQASSARKAASWFQRGRVRRERLLRELVHSDGSL